MVEGADFRGEEEGAGGGEVERFLAAAVAGEEEFAGFLVVEGDGEHAVDFFQHVFAPLEPCGGEDFAVAAGVEGVAEGFEVSPEVLPVVDFSVADGLDSAAGGGEGLGAVGGVEDGEACHACGEWAGGEVAVAVGASVVEAAEHPVELPVSEVESASDAAHGREYSGLSGGGKSWAGKIFDGQIGWGVYSGGVWNRVSRRRWAGWVFLVSAERVLLRRCGGGC